MIIMKNLVALAAIFLAVPALYVGVTVPAFMATSYLMVSMFCAGVATLAMWSLTNTNKGWLCVFGILWALMMVVGNGAV
jgi:hypothetical protein